MNCAICFSPKTRRVNRIEDFVVHRCRECGAGFLSPQPDDSYLAKLYSETYYHSWGFDDETKRPLASAMKRATFALYLDMIQRYKKSGTILDVGCATGIFLEEARARGFEAYGVEVSLFAAQEAQRIMGAGRVFNGKLESCPHGDGTFDVITMFDLFEHVKDPMAALRKAHALLKDEGVLVIMTPDIGSFTAKAMGAAWSHYKPEHIFYYGRRSLELIARQCGFSLDRYVGAKKVITLEYALTQFTAYPHRYISRILKWISGIIPGKMRWHHFCLPMGESIAVLIKVIP
jgi:2-polyprenyl-3-methyl-5-hydroxy-6-metoxy-1,4-benzoquinol methylase